MAKPLAACVVAAMMLVSIVLVIEHGDVTGMLDAMFMTVQTAAGVMLMAALAGAAVEAAARARTRRRRATSWSGAHATVALTPPTPAPRGR